MTLSADHIVILILLLALAVKFIFFENKEELAEQLRVHMSERLNADHLDNHDYNQLNRNLTRRFTSGMPFFRSQSFFLDRGEFSDDAKDGKYIPLMFLKQINQNEM